MEQPPSSGSFHYHLLVLGAGPGGQAAAKEASRFQKRVLLIDLLAPSPDGANWDVASMSSVNVAAIRKLLHQASLLGEAVGDSQKFGWKLKERVTHEWSDLVEAVWEHVKRSALELRAELTERGVTYLSGHAEIVAPHTVEVRYPGGGSARLTAETLLIDVGERHRSPGVPGGREHCVSSDDLFHLRRPPRRTLVVGGSPEGLECAGVLRGLGHEVTVMLTPTFDLLPGFDRKMAQKIENHMLVHGVDFIHQHTLSKVEEMEAGGGDGVPGAPAAPARLSVTVTSTEGAPRREEFDTVVLAAEREACTAAIGLECVGVKRCQRSGRIQVNDGDQTSVDHVFALGSAVVSAHRSPPPGLWERAGTLLARRLYGGDAATCDYADAPVALFTPLEYASCGLTEERANLAFGEANVEVYHSHYWPLEWTVPNRDKNSCYVKVICHIPAHERVVGLHVMGPNAGDVVQGFAAAMRCGLTKRQLDATAAVHPASAKVLTALTLTQRHSEAAALRGNC